MRGEEEMRRLGIRMENKRRCISHRHLAVCHLCMPVSIPSVSADTTRYLVEFLTIEIDYFGKE